VTVRRTPELFTRAAGNPILTAEGLPYLASTVFNPGAARVDGEVLLLTRVEDRRGISQLHVARSADGIGDWRFDPAPLVVPEPDGYPEEIWGCEDPRLTWLDELQEWAIAYTAYSRLGPLVSLATTTDFRSIRRLGAVMPPEDKDAALFPRRIDGRWAMIHRPSPLRGSAHMWISYSPDLRHWGDHSVLLEARDGAWWDAGKIGLGPPPIGTEHGWLTMYHGVHVTGDGPIYRVGFVLFDLDDPTVVLRRCDEWAFGPEERYEREGDVDKVVFPCGWIVDQERDEILLYYGAADMGIGVATARFGDVMDHVLSCPTPEPRHRPRPSGAR